MSTTRLLLALLLLLAALPSPASAAQEFFPQTGYAVSDDGGVRFLSELRRLGGVQAVGYPASDRFEWEGFTVQAFQRVVFQWRPESGRVAFVNVFDRLNALGKDEWLESVRQTPRHAVPADPLSSLEGWPAIRAKYYSVPDPVQFNGLPTSRVQDMGNHYALRAQRVVFQQWKEDVPWARRGEVTVALGGDIAKEAGVLPLGQAPPKPTAKRTALGYYVEWDPRSWYSLEANADALDYVGAQWVWVNSCGDFTTRDDRTLKQFAQARGIGVLPSMLTLSGALNHQLLTVPAVTDRLIANIVAYVEREGYPGFDADLEGIEARDRDAYSSFIARLAQALHARGKILAMAIPPKESDTRTGWAGPYDYAALGRHADLITLMTYDYHGSWGSAGPVAPIEPVSRAVAYAASQIPPHKVLMGLSFYGYDWNLTTPRQIRAIGYPEAAAIAERYRVGIGIDPPTRSATFRYRAAYGDPLPSAPRVAAPRHDVVETRAPPCGQPQPPGPSPTPTPAPPPPTAMQDHVVWLEEARSAAARLEVVDRLGVGGFGAWRLGQEDPAVWPVVREWRAR